MRAGDASARDELFNRACARLRRIARKLLGHFPALKRWEDTDDVLQNSSLRLWQALKQVTPESPRHFFNLAAMHIRHVVIDMARHYKARPLPQILPAGSASTGQPRCDPSDSTYDPRRLSEWAEFHEKISELPDEEREMFNLLWYHKLTQAEAAQVLGVDEKTVRRHWQAARLLLRERLHGDMPE
jgi:RNA polymerase sigma-70 factor (ECF subfamily)